MQLLRGQAAAPALAQGAAARAAARSLSCCAEAEALSPGTVPRYDAHICLRLPAAAAASRPPPPVGSSWPQLVEREAAVVSAFAAVAKHQELISGTVKLTAFEELPSSSGAQVRCCRAAPPPPAGAERPAPSCPPAFLPAL